MVVERESAIEQMREEAKRNSDKTEQLEAEVKLLKEKNKKLNVENEQMSRGIYRRAGNFEGINFHCFCGSRCVREN